MNRLTKLANKYETDKGTKTGVANGYTEFYQRFFNEYESPNIVEIGIFHGGSVKMMNEFFDGNCNILACDIDESSETYIKDIDAAKFFHVDASKEDSLIALKNEIDSNGGADIIIDDASHFWADQMLALRILCNSVKNGGIYIIEDMHLGLLKWSNLFRSDASIEDSPLFYVLYPQENGFLTEEQHNLLRSKIESVEVFSKKNEKQTVLQVADGRCITAVIKFN